MNILRHRPFLEATEDIKLKNTLRKEYIKSMPLQETIIDIIMPTYNRSRELVEAIHSITGQIHKNWKLHICDDGSTDSTRTMMKRFEHDNRINYIKLPHQGVSHARNAGLREVSGEYISFLDSDNTWKPEYLSLMVTFMSIFKLDSAYCAAKLIGENEQLWLGDVFSWKACAELNYIDLNCFMTRSSNRKSFFDESLRRFVDWDYILGITQSSRVSYLSLAQVDYSNRDSLSRITCTVHQGKDQDHYLNAIRNKYSRPRGSWFNKDVRVKDEN